MAAAPALVRNTASEASHSRLLAGALCLPVLLAASWLLFHDAEGFPTRIACVAFAFSVSLLVLIGFAHTAWASSARWLALALAGQALTLELIDAGPAIHYQHYRTIQELLSPAYRMFLLGFAAQALLVTWGLSGIIKPAWNLFARTFSPWRRCMLAVLLIAPAAALSRDAGRFSQEVVCAVLIQAVHLGNVVLIAWHLPKGMTLWPAQPIRFRKLLVGAAAWTLLVTAMLSTFVYERSPHVPDELSYVLQARMFAQGHLTLPAPPAPEAFRLDLMTYEPTRWYSPFPPGWPAVLAIGMRLGAPWLVNPILAALGVILAGLFLKEMYGERVARAAVLLLCVSPWYLFLGMSLMSHMAVFVAAVAGAWGAWRARQSGVAGWAIAGGLAIGVVSLIRPLDGLTLAGVLGLWMLTASLPLRRRLLVVSALALGSALTGVLALPYNAHLTGHALKFPVDDYFDRYYAPGVNALGFGPNRGIPWPLDPFPGHGLRDVVVNGALNLFSMNVELFGWGFGSLLLVGIGLMARGSASLAVAAVAAPLVYSLYWFNGGPDFGARYWWLAFIPCLVLAIRGYLSLGGGTRLQVVAAALGLIAAVDYLPWRAVDKYHGYLYMRPDLAELAGANHWGRTLVFVRGAQHPDFASAAALNSLDPNAPVPLYVWERDEATRQRVLRAFPDRPVATVIGPSITHRGFQLEPSPPMARRVQSDNR